MKKSILQTKRSYFLWALLLTILFPVGIVLIVFGFSRGIPLLGVLGIVLTVLGFYVMPILWVQFANWNYYQSLYSQITKDGIRKISLLAQTNGKDKNQIAADIRKLISSRHLNGYVILENEHLINKEETEHFDSLLAHKTGTAKHIQCPSCGADLELIDGYGVCSYCGKKVSETTPR